MGDYSECLEELHASLLKSDDGPTFDVELAAVIFSTDESNHVRIHVAEGFLIPIHC